MTKRRTVRRYGPYEVTFANTLGGYIVIVEDRSREAENLFRRQYLSDAEWREMVQRAGSAERAARQATLNQMFDLID